MREASRHRFDSSSGGLSCKSDKKCPAKDSSFERVDIRLPLFEKWCQYKRAEGKMLISLSATASCWAKEDSGSRAPIIEQDVLNTSIGCASAGFRSRISRRGA